MTYRYILRVKNNGNKRKLAVEAWPNKKGLATKKEKSKPSFIIGSLSGPKTHILDFIVKDLSKKYETKPTKTGFKIIFPEKSIEAIAEAYRIGLMLAALSISRDQHEDESIIRYIEKCTPEEIWFWTSKYLGMITKQSKPQKVVSALAILAK